MVYNSVGAIGCVGYNWISQSAILTVIMANKVYDANSLLYRIRAINSTINAMGRA